MPVLALSWKPDGTVDKKIVVTEENAKQLKRVGIRCELPAREPENDDDLFGWS